MRITREKQLDDRDLLALKMSHLEIRLRIYLTGNVTNNNRLFILLVMNWLRLIYVSRGNDYRGNVLEPGQRSATDDPRWDSLMG